MMQAVGRYYVRYINTVYQRTGTLWEGRYKSTLVDDEYYFLTVCRYIELNPVRAGMVDHPSEYPWSSYRANGVGKRIGLISPHRVYIALGKTEKERQEYYRGLFKGLISDLTLGEIREATNKAWVLGSDKFKQEIQPAVNRRINSLGWGGDRKSSRYQAEVRKSKTLTP